MNHLDKISESPIVSIYYYIQFCRINLIDMADFNFTEMDNKFLDDLTINLTDFNEVLYWCKRLNCEQIELVNSVHFIGCNANMVDLFLELNKWKCNSPNNM